MVHILIYVLGQSCSVSHLQQPNLGQNYLTKIGARPDKTSNKLLLGPIILAWSRQVMTNKTYSMDGLFRARYTFLVAGGGGGGQWIFLSHPQELDSESKSWQIAFFGPNLRFKGGVRGRCWRCYRI